MTKLALVTGGHGAIGGATVTLLEAAGWQVDAPARAELDFDNEVSVDAYVEARPEVEYDAIVFSHGVWYSYRPEMREYRDWGRLYASRVALPIEVMENFIYRTDSYGLTSPERPCVVMVASTRGFIGGVDTGPYSAACAAQIALMQGYAREWPNARFDAVCPGLTESKLGQQVIATGGAKAGAIGQDPADVARVIVGLVTDGVSNGRVVRVVDGKASDAKWGWE